MTAGLKVYGWQSHRAGAPGHGQTREIVAARSKAAVARLAGVRAPSNLFNLTETGNVDEVATALSRPGVVFWKGMYGRDGGSWRAVEPATEGVE